MTGGNPGGIIIMILGALLVYIAVKAVKGKSFLRWLNNNVGGAYTTGLAGALVIHLRSGHVIFRPLRAPLTGYHKHETGVT